MAYSSASTDNTTPQSRQHDRWESVRLFGGVVGLLLVAAGILGLAVLATEDGTLTSGIGSGLAGCIVAVVGGGQLARTCFGSQRSADRTAAFMARLDTDDDRLDELHGELAELRNTLTAALLGFAEDRAAREQFTQVMEKFLTHEETVDEHSAKARSDVASILDLLAKQDLEAADRWKQQAGMVSRLDGLEAALGQLGERLAGIEADSAAMREEISKGLAEGRLETIVIEAIRKAYALGYVDGMEDRPPRHIRSVPPFDQR